MKFVAQKTSNSCGAVAVLNLFRKIGHKKIPIRDIPKLSKKINTDSDGTLDKDLKQYLRKEGFIVSSCNSIMFSSLKYLIASGKDLILTIDSPFYESHYTTVVGANHRGLYLANSLRWEDLQKDKQQISRLKPIAFYSFQNLKKICSKKDYDLSVIIIKTS